MSKAKAPLFDTNVILAVLIIAILGVIWWFTRPPVAATGKIAETPMSAKADTTKQVAPPITKIAPSVVPPAPILSQAPPGATGSTPQTVATLIPNADSIAELKDVLTDMARLYRASDLATLAQNYTPPEELKPNAIQSLREAQAGLQTDEGSQRNLKAVAESVEALENQTPTFNDAGDEATYTTYTPPSESDYDSHTYTYTGAGEQHPMTFIKINGKWYIGRPRQ